MPLDVDRSPSANTALLGELISPVSAIRKEESASEGQCRSACDWQAFTFKDTKN